MSTASNVQLSSADATSLCYSVPEHITPASAQRTSALLQQNHVDHDIFFNSSGFHNHIVHHLLTLYALGASPAQIQKQYAVNESYQRPAGKAKEGVVHEMSDASKFVGFLGKARYYSDFLRYFQQEIETKGWESVVDEVLFRRDQRAEAMLGRLFAGFLHPQIHLGFGVEFNQPAIIAESLAQTAVHEGWMKDLLISAEDAASSRSSEPSKSFVEIIDQIQATISLRDAADVDGNRIRDGIMRTDSKTMIDMMSQYKISSADELEERTAEMINTTAYFTAAAQNPPKLVKMDFFYMHSINASIFFSAFLKQNWLSDENKIRLLEWKVRNDAALYASRGCARLLLDEITDYKPKRPSGWAEIIDRVTEHEDDGHACKLIRALAHGEQVCKPFEHNKDSFRIKGDMWLKLGHMAIDSVESPPPRWVRSCGYASAWTEVQDRPSAHL
ncbi:hypothetical protein AAFC00_003639 [Neodothiora populina]